MIDPLAATTLALTAHSPRALWLTFLAGALTSIGPCVAPRYIAIAAITSGYRRPIVPTLAFVAGLLGAFVAIGFGAGLLGSLTRSSTLLYAALSCGLIVGGCLALVRAVPHQSATRAACCAARPGTPDGVRRSLGGVFLLGAISALVVSPCCTPVIAGIVATSTAIGKPLLGMTLLATFALGHALPLFLAGGATSLVRRGVRLDIPTQAPAIIGAILMLALGAYYGILA